MALFAQVLGIPKNLSPNCIHLKLPQVPWSLAFYRKTVPSNNLPQSQLLDRDASARPRKMSNRLNLTLNLLLFNLCTLCARDFDTLSGSPAKSGPLDFGTKNNFPLFFVREKGLARIYKKAIYYFAVSYFCFATSQNCILAELRLPTVIRTVKFTDFVKRDTSPKMQLAEFRFHKILRYIHYFD